MLQYVFKPIGIVRSPFAEPQGTPVQPIGVADVYGTVVIHDEFAPGLQDLDGFSHNFWECLETALVARIWKYGTAVETPPARCRLARKIVRLSKPLVVSEFTVRDCLPRELLL